MGVKQSNPPPRKVMSVFDDAIKTGEALTTILSALKTLLGTADRDTALTWVNAAELFRTGAEARLRELDKAEADKVNEKRATAVAGV